jgi:hypothetical protein
MDKYKESNKKSKKNYNSDKTFVQIKKETHIKLKEYCDKNSIKIKDYLEKIIIENIS